MNKKTIKNKINRIYKKIQKPQEKILRCREEQDTLYMLNDILDRRGGK